MGGAITEKLGVAKTMANENSKVVISALLGTALGITITYMTGVASNRTEIVRLTTQVENLTQTITNSLVDSYGAADALRDFGYIYQIIADIKQQDKETETEMRVHFEKDKMTESRLEAHIQACKAIHDAKQK